MSATGDETVLLRKLSSIASIGDGDAATIADLCQTIRHYRSGDELVRDGEAPAALFAVLSGWAVRQKILESGNRQIISLLLPGDLTEPFGVLPKVMSHSITALTPLVVAQLDPKHLRELAARNDAIGQALWWDVLESLMTSFQRTVTLGAFGAQERMSHLFCEVHYRLARLGLTEDDSFHFLLTQNDMGDLLGLSAVHVNRTLQSLRASGMISLSDKKLSILDREALYSFASFDPSYFHQEGVLRREGRSAAVSI